MQVASAVGDVSLLQEREGRDISTEELHSKGNKGKQQPRRVTVSTTLCLVTCRPDIGLSIGRKEEDQLAIAIVAQTK